MHLSIGIVGLPNVGKSTLFTALARKSVDASGSEAAARAHGKSRVEDRDYLVQDGDVMHFRFNV